MVIFDNDGLQVAHFACNVIAGTLLGTSFAGLFFEQMPISLAAFGASSSLLVAILAVKCKAMIRNNDALKKSQNQENQ